MGEPGPQALRTENMRVKFNTIYRRHIAILVCLAAVSGVAASAAAASAGAVAVPHPENASLCSIISADQANKQVKLNGLREIDVRLFAESSAANRALAKQFRQSARAAKVSAHEVRLIGYSDCDSMKRLADALNSTYFNAPQIRCAGKDGLLYRISHIGDIFKMDILTLSKKENARVVLKRATLNVVEAGGNCRYRMTLAHPDAQLESEEKKFRICVPSLAGSSDGHIQMSFNGRSVPNGIRCESDPSFSRYTQQLAKSTDDVPTPPRRDDTKARRARAPQSAATSYQ